MIERDERPGGHGVRFVLRPQRSATWRENLWLVAAVALPAVTIALAWTAAGFWPILPLCGLELALLTALLYRVSHSLLAREVLVIDDDRITIEAGHREVERRFELGRHWAQVILQPARSEWHSSRLLIREAGRAIECGRFLTNEERAELAEQLRRAVMAVPDVTGPGAR